MIISCPECQTKYTVPAQSFGAAGRVVKCTKCGNKWHQKPSEAFEAQGTQFSPDGESTPKDQLTAAASVNTPSVDKDAMPSLSDVTQQAAPQDDTSQEALERRAAERMAARNAAKAAEEAKAPPYSPHNIPTMPGSQSPQNMWPGVMLGIAATIGLIGAILVLKDLMMRAFPAMAQAFGGHAAIAEFDPSYSQAPGMVIENIERDILEDDGFTTYVIQGIVTNSNLAEKPVPNLTVSLLDEHGAVLDNWKVEPQKRVLQPGESTTWVCYFYNPPLAKVSEYKVAFATES